MTNSQTESIEITLNGERREVPAGGSVATLLTHLGVDPALVAVELDRRIVRRRDWPAAAILPLAKVEIVHFVGGG